MDTTVNSKKLQVVKLAYDYEKLLSDHGYSTFIESHPLLAVNHVVWRLFHASLREQADGLLRLNREQYKSDYNQFLRDITEKAEILDSAEGKVHTSQKRFDENNRNYNDLPMKKQMKKCGNPPSFQHKKNTKRKRSSEEDANPGQTKRRNPRCINPKCNDYHWLKHCPLARSQSERNQIYKEWKTKKEKSMNVAVLENQKEIGNCGSVFQATFNDGAVECTAIVDTGADISIIPADLFTKIQETNPLIECRVLDHTAYFGLADKTADSLPCSRQISLSINLRVRHAAALNLRNISWYISDRPLQHVIIGRDVLQSLGIDTKSLMYSIFDRMGPDIEISQDFPENGTIATIMAQTEDALFYSEEPSIETSCDHIAFNKLAMSGWISP